MNEESRLLKLRQLMAAESCQALLIDKPLDIFYLTGLELSSGRILVTEQEAFLIVDGRYIESSKKQNIYSVLLLKENLLPEVLKQCKIDQLSFDEQQTSYRDFLVLSQLTKTISIQLTPLHSLVQKLRLIKDAHEIELLRKAAKLGYEGYQFVLSLLKEGISEKELAFELEFFWKKRGGQRLAFDPIIAFSPHSSMPHYRAGENKLVSGQSVLIDIGVVLAHYHSDMTRVHFFGPPDPVIERINDIVKEAHRRALSICRPGTLINDLDAIAREWIAAQGHGDFFLHSLGHGIGLEIHEPPTIKQTIANREISLLPGMVVTIEPGIYLPDIGGVRYEDTILITEEGYENLTN